MSADSLKRKITAGVLFLIKNSDGIQHAEDRDTGVGEYREPHGGDSERKSFYRKGEYHILVGDRACASRDLDGFRNGIHA